jgi:hypothetical protein
MAMRCSGGGIRVIILGCAYCCGIYGDGWGPGPSRGGRILIIAGVGHIREWPGLEVFSFLEMKEFQMPRVECVCLLLCLGLLSFAKSHTAFPALCLRSDASKPSISGGVLTCCWPSGFDDNNKGCCD